jgi:hypothetical protein
MAKKLRNNPTTEPKLEYVLRVAPPTKGIIPNYEVIPQWVESIEGGIVRTDDFEKARRFKGGWLNETVWSWSLYYTAIIYTEALNEWKTTNRRRAEVNRKSVAKSKRVPRNKKHDKRPHVRARSNVGVASRKPVVGRPSKKKVARHHSRRRAAR